MSDFMPIFEGSKAALPTKWESAKQTITKGWIKGRDTIVTTLQVNENDEWSKKALKYSGLVLGSFLLVAGSIPSFGLSIAILIDYAQAYERLKNGDVQPMVLELNRIAGDEDVTTLQEKTSQQAQALEDQAKLLRIQGDELKKQKELLALQGDEQQRLILEQSQKLQQQNQELLQQQEEFRKHANDINRQNLDLEVTLKEKEQLLKRQGEQLEQQQRNLEEQTRELNRQLEQLELERQQLEQRFEKVNRENVDLQPVKQVVQEHRKFTQDMAGWCLSLLQGQQSAQSQLLAARQSHYDAIKENQDRAQEARSLENEIEKMRVDISGLKTTFEEISEALKKDMQEERRSRSPSPRREPLSENRNVEGNSLQPPSLSVLPPAPPPAPPPPPAIYSNGRVSQSSNSNIATDFSQVQLRTVDRAAVEKEKIEEPDLFFTLKAALRARHVVIQDSDSDSEEDSENWVD